jgi:hypothetical protein
MANINMPPDGGPLSKLQMSKYCQKFQNDPLTITVKDDGEFLSFPPGDFEPNLPTGFYPKGEVLGPFVPTHNNKDVFMVYVDNVTKKVFVLQIEIRSAC